MGIEVIISAVLAYEVHSSSFSDVLCENHQSLSTFALGGRARQFGKA
jgi:hypothetical protein